MLRQRLIYGISLALGIIALLLLDGWLSEHFAARWSGRRGTFDAAVWLTNGAICAAILVTFTWLAARELALMARALGFQPLKTFSQLFAAGLALGPYVSTNLPVESIWHDQSLGMLWMALALGVAFLMQARRWQTQQAIPNVATTLFIIFYTGGLAGFMTKLRMEVGANAGVVVLMFSVFVTKITDTGAYFVGRLIGRHKMIEWLSPRKTWEGFVGGLVTAIVASVALGAALEAAGIAPFHTGRAATVWGLAGFGLVIGVFSVAGDLCESLLKRDAAVKDSGAALPGLGGVLDVFDSPLLTAPAAWFFWTRVANVI